MSINTIHEHRESEERASMNAQAHAERLPPGIAMTAAIDDVSASAVDAQEQLQRLQADFVNFRRRAADVADRAAHDRAVQIIALLLPVMDDFERALRTETKDVAYAEGVRLTYRHLTSILTSIGLQPIHAAGEAFDPHAHEAVMRVETDAVPEGTVLEEFRRGYRLNGTLVRPAQVSVAASSTSG